MAAARALLKKSALPRDALPYTDEFASLKAEYERENGPIPDVDFWRLLDDVGKHGGLGTGRKKLTPRTPSLTDEEQLEIIRLLTGETGRRDHLPYTSRFDELRRRFNAQTKRGLTPHEFWRSISRVAKLSRKPEPLFDTAPLGGLPSDVVMILERMNPWWRAEPAPQTEPFRRWAFHEVVRRLQARVAPVVAIRGPRQVGKTTIQMQLIEELLFVKRVGAERILRVQFDELPVLGSLQQPVEAIVRWYEEHVLRTSINSAAKNDARVFLFFDELQNLNNWSAQLKSLVDHIDANVLVTGSSALRIARERDSLAGRLSMIELGPLRLWEIAGLRQLGDIRPLSRATDEWRSSDFWFDLIAHGQRNRTIVKKAFGYFSALGGYPRCHARGSTERGLLAEQIVDTVVTRTIETDVTQKHLSVDQRLLRECFRLVARYAGQAVTSHRIGLEIGQTLQSAVPDSSVDEAIQFFADSMLIHKVAPLELLLRKQSNPPKLCLCDHFVRSALLQEVVPLLPEELSQENEAVATVAGHIIESSAGYYLQGIPGLDVSWYPARQDEPEVDFILTIGTQRIPIEVKYRRDVAGDNIDRFCSKPHHAAAFGIVVTQDLAAELSPTTIAVPASTFLLLA
jgi:predicted AAA+ superfamily ATPase